MISLDVFPDLDSLNRELARRDLGDFVELTSSFVLEGWQRLLCQRLMRLKDEFGQRLLVHGPPQFGKSLIVSQRFPAWMLGHRPELRVRLACYNQLHATRFSKLNLEIMQTPDYQAVFQEASCRVPMSAPASGWYTVEREKAMDSQPSCLALGLNSGFTGQGADLLVIDDPYKNREEAYSTKIRENVWGWWTESVLPRLNPLSNVVVMFHRWHSDDLAGRLLAEGGWESIRFPAIADGGADDPSGRQVGEPLSSRYPVTYLNELKKRQGSAAFNSLYQGRPVADGGNLLKRHWWRFWYPQGMPEPPALRVPMPDGSQFVCPQAPLPKEFHEALLSWDMAFKGADDSDFVVGQCWKRKDADKYLIDQVRAQLDFPATLQAVRAQVARFPEASTVLVEDKANGSAVLQVLAREISGLIPVQPQGGKEARVAAAAPAVESGNVYLPHPTLYPWVEGFIERSAAFPAGPNDDEQDAFSQALVRFRMTEFNLEKWQRPRDDDEAPSTADILEQFRRRKRGGE